MLCSQEAEPASPAEADGPARALGEVGAPTDVLIEDVAVGERPFEELAIFRRPTCLRQMLQVPIEAHFGLLLGRRCFRTAASRCSMTSFP